MKFEDHKVENKRQDFRALENRGVKVGSTHTLGEWSAGLLDWFS